MVHLFVLDALVRPSIPPDENALRAALRETADSATLHPLHQLKHRRFAKLERRLSELKDWVRLLDIVERSGAYSRVLKSFRARVADPQLLPSPTVARRFQSSGSDWTRFGVQSALSHRQNLTQATQFAHA